jgi:glutamine synthetase
LHESAFFRTALGDRFVNYIVTIKQAEIARFLAEVTDWEQREYFDIF